MSCLRSDLERWTNRLTNSEERVTTTPLTSRSGLRHKHAKRIYKKNERIKKQMQNYKEKEKTTGNLTTGNNSAMVKVTG